MKNDFATFEIICHCGVLIYMLILETVKWDRLPGSLYLCEEALSLPEKNSKGTLVLTVDTW